jgi:hypothetical protein
VPVRAGPARHGESAALDGHERSRPVCKHPRSSRIPAEDPEQLSRETAGSNPHPNRCHGPVALANEASGRRGLASPCTRADADADRSEPRQFSLPVPPACQIGRAAPVSSGQPRSRAPYR